MRQITANLAGAEIAAAVGTTDTTISVTDASALPVPGTDEYWVGVLYAESGGVESGHEIVHVTDISATNLTVTRAAEPLADGTQAEQTFAAGDHIELRLTSGSVDRIRTTARVNDSAGTTIEVSDGDVRVIALTADTTLTDNLSDGESATLRITGGDSWTVTWPTMTWPGGSVPTLGAAHWVEMVKLGGVLYGWDLGAE